MFPVSISRIFKTSRKVFVTKSLFSRINFYGSVENSYHLHWYIASSTSRYSHGLQVATLLKYQSLKYISGNFWSTNSGAALEKCFGWAVATEIIFPAWTIMLFQCLVLGFVSLFVNKAKTLWLWQLSNLLLMCLMFHIRVVHFFGILKKESNYTKYLCLLSQKKYISQAYLL